MFIYKTLSSKPLWVVLAHATLGTCAWHVALINAHTGMKIISFCTSENLQMVYICAGMS